VSKSGKPEGPLGQILRIARSAFIGNKTIDAAQTSKRVPATGATGTPAPAPSAGELINEGLRERQRIGTAAARPYFERAAQLEPNSHVPWFMLGNVASELGDLDAAVAHYEHARALRPSDHVIRYNLGLNQLSRGYIDGAIEELRAACGLNPSYLQAQSSHIVALHNSDRISPEEIAAAIREWGARFSLEHPASALSAVRSTSRVVHARRRHPTNVSTPHRRSWTSARRAAPWRSHGLARRSRAVSEPSARERTWTRS